MKRKMFKRILVLTGTAVMLLASTSLLTSCDSFEAEPLPLPENQLQPIKDKSIEELEEYKVLADYREAEQKEIASILSAAKTAIQEAGSEKDILTIVNNAKEQLDMLKTALAYKQEEEEQQLADTKKAKMEGLTELLNGFAEEDYRPQQWQSLLDIIAAARQEIEAMTSLTEVENFNLTAVQIKLNEVKTDSVLLQEELSTKKENKLAELAALYDLYKNYRYSAETLTALTAIYDSSQREINACETLAEVENIAITGSASVEEEMKRLPFAVAGRGTKYFDSLAEALAFSSEGAVCLYADIVCDVVIAEGSTIILDLNGYTLTNAASHTISNYGTLTITDSSPSKSGTIDNLTHARAAIVNQVGASLTIEEAHLTRSLENGKNSENNGGNSYYVLQNFGTAVIKGGSVTQNGQYSSMIANGWYDGTTNTAKTNAVLKIENGMFSGGLNTIKNDDYGIATISGGTFTNFSQAAVFNVHELTIEGGTIDGTNAIQAIYTRYYNTGFDSGKTIIGADAVIKGAVTGYDAYYHIAKENTSITAVSLDISDGWALVNALKYTATSYLPSDAVLSIRLVKNIALPKEGYVYRRNVILDLNGKTLSLAYAEGESRTNYATLVIAQSTVIINDSSAAQTGKVINTDITGGGLTDGKDYNFAVRVGANGDLTINAGYYYSSANSAGEGSSCIYIYQSNKRYSAKVTINGGTFATEKDYNGVYFVLNVDDTKNYGAEFIINGGTFVNYQPGTTDTGTNDSINVKENAVITSAEKEGSIYYTVS